MHDSKIKVNAFIVIVSFTLSFLSNMYAPMVCAAPNEALMLGSFPDQPPKIDGVVASNEWSEASRIVLDHCTIMVLNDAANLYLLIDVTTDTTDDPLSPEPPWGDYFWLSFDVDLNWAITRFEDILYSPNPSTQDLGMAHYTGAGTTTALEDTHSQLGAGFDSTMNSRIPHRIWELAISMPEILAVPKSLAQLNKVPCGPAKS